MKITVANIKSTKIEPSKDKLYIYVGRGKAPKGSIFLGLGNPYTVAEYGRGVALATYNELFPLNDIYQKRLTMLKNIISYYGAKEVILLCWCHPEPCHANTIKEYLIKELNIKNEPKQTYQELQCEMLHEDCDVLVITTNGYVSKSGKAVMGRGIAKQVKDLYEDIDYLLGSLIKEKGNNVHILGQDDSYKTIVSFPVKPDYEISDGNNFVSHANYPIGSKVYGYHCKARLDIIERSLIQLVELADNNPSWKRILIPRVGCGAGELTYGQVKPLLDKYLDGRFVVCYK